MNTTKTLLSEQPSRSAIEDDARTRSTLLSLAALMGGREEAPGLASVLASIEDVDELTAKVVMLFEEQVAASQGPDRA